MLTQKEIINSELRALNLKHPYAQLMLPPFNKQETRTWKTDYRGLVLICASVNPYGDRELIQIAGPEQYARIIQLLGPKWFNSVKRGSAIAIGRLVDCVPMVSHAQMVGEKQIENETFVKFDRTLYVHEYADVTPIKTFPWRGGLGWQKVTDEQKKRIEPLK
jgi:hypothetical protein